MDGEIIRRTLATAPNWFAAFPSLHGGYPVLLFMILWRERRASWLAAVAVYGAAMWASTVVLNQHYVVDLVAGAGVAVAAFWFTELLRRRGILERFGGAPCQAVSGSPSP
jgi:membrane-associated phospholipid phosphatase